MKNTKRESIFASIQREVDGGNFDFGGFRDEDFIPKLDTGLIKFKGVDLYKSSSEDSVEELQERMKVFNRDYPQGKGVMVVPTGKVVFTISNLRAVGLQVKADLDFFYRTEEEITNFKEMYKYLEENRCAILLVYDDYQVRYAYTTGLVDRTALVGVSVVDAESLGDGADPFPLTVEQLCHWA